METGQVTQTYQLKKELEYVRAMMMTQQRYINELEAHIDTLESQEPSQMLQNLVDASFREFDQAEMKARARANQEMTAYWKRHYPSLR